MARGAQAKQEITQKILGTFPGAFVVDKVIRIPMTEDGAEIQIKCSLTAAKDIVAAEHPKVTTTPPAPNSEVPFDEGNFMNPPEDSEDWKMTKEEKQRVAAMMSKLGL